MFSNWKSKKPTVTFAASKTLVDALPHPRPAAKFMPKWLQAMEKNGDKSVHASKPTIKSCLPVIEAVSNGYIIPLWADLIIKIDETNSLYAEFSGNITKELGHEMLTCQLQEEIGQNNGLTNMSVHGIPLKFSTPWDIITPPGYSVLIKSPPYVDHNIHILEGVVDTDTYTIAINFPFVWTGRERGEWLIPRGTPIAQVIPFKRIETRLEIAVADKTRRETNKHLLNSIRVDKYRKLFWHKRKGE